MGEIFNLWLLRYRLFGLKLTSQNMYQDFYLIWRFIENLFQVLNYHELAILSTLPLKHLTF